jgi:immunoglobulin-binding protein 1
MMVEPNNPEKDLKYFDECTLLSRYQQAIEAISAGNHENTTDEETNALTILLDLKARINSSHILSRNESLLDIPTFNLPFISIQYHIAMAYLAKSEINERRYANLNRSMDLLHSFLRQIDDIMALSAGEEGERLYREYNIRAEYHSLLSTLDEEEEEEANCFPKHRKKDWMRAAETSRQEKIARLKRRRSLETDIERLLRSEGKGVIRRNRALDGQRDHKHANYDYDNCNEEEDDNESIKREIYTKQLILYCILGIEELYECRKEMEMLKISIQMERQKRQYSTTTNMQTNHEQSGSETLQQETQKLNASNPSKPMEVTHITQDPVTGKLVFQKEKIKSNVFRPSWNLPTVSLAQFAEQERLAALQRSKQQDEGELNAPKRYDQLVAEGMEDDIHLVDASAVLDRKWDDLIDEKPRGSGNKMGDRCDCNF